MDMNISLLLAGTGEMENSNDAMYAGKTNVDDLKYVFLQRHILFPLVI